MIEFYNLSPSLLILISFLTYMTVGFQTASVVVYCLSRRVQGKSIIPRLFFEGSLVFITLFAIYMLAQVQLQPRATYSFPERANILRITLFSFSLVSNLLLSFVERKARLIIYPFFLLSFLPLFERRFTEIYPYCFLIMLVFLMLRSVYLMLNFLSSQSNLLSTVSAKAGIDELDTGILFFKPNGRIILFNQRMEALMYQLTNKIHRDAKSFYSDYLASANCNPECQRIDSEKYLAYILPDQTVWLFTISTLEIRKRTYYQLTASNITEIWLINQRLRSQKEKLSENREQLEKAMANISYMAKAEANLEVKNRLHDVLGQKIALLMRNVEAGTEPDEELLNSFFLDLREQLQETDSLLDLKLQIERHQEMFKDVGVKLNFRGNLPTDEKLAAFFCEAIFEASTNAIRHGFASLIDAEIEDTVEGLQLTITNNGQVLEQEIVYGSGLKRLELKTLAFEGIMEVVGSPQFTLHIEIPLRHE